MKTLLCLYLLFLPGCCNGCHICTVEHDPAMQDVGRIVVFSILGLYALVWFFSVLNPEPTAEERDVKRKQRQKEIQERKDREERAGL